MDTFTAATAFPASLVGRPGLAFCVITAFMVGLLLCLQWLYSIIDDGRAHPAPKGHPLSHLRRIKAIILIAAIIPALPRGILLMTWHKLSPYYREALSLTSWVVFIPAGGLLAYAWLLDRGLRPMEVRTVAVFPIAKVLPVTRGQKTRGLLTLSLIFVSAFAITFVRPSSDVHRTDTVVELR